MTMIEKYELQSELGAGGMGTVFRSVDTRTNQTVAIKQLKNEIARLETIERFKREGEALRELNHPNIVKMLDMFEHEGQHYLVMEYVTGGDLKDLLDNGAIEYQKCVNMAIDLADALTRAHRLDIIHRDLKPANVLIGDDGTLRLTDFGVAHVGSKERVTETDAVVGTIDYLPPEAFSGGTFDSRGDIWAFGVMLFEMLSGQRPFAGDSILETIQAIITQPIPDLEALCPDIPIALIDLVYRMLERDPRMRISSIRHVGAALEDILEGRSISPQTGRFDTDIPDFSVLPIHNLPAQTTPFVGREHELAELENLLVDLSIRLVTILAQGGMGKTRLGLELAQRAVDDNLYADGVYFVELAPLSDANNIPNAIGDACGFQFLGDGAPKQQLLDILKERNMLLVLDNCEHLADGFGLVSEILQAAPNVHIIATSRRRLSQAGETLFHLAGMDFPDWDNPEDALEYAAIKLFMNSARRVQPAFELTEDNLDIVARICKLIQGMPLGIVLAASWLTILSVEEIADEIQGGLDFLETDETDLPERQRSIRAVMDYSWAQMTETERQVFMKLSIFHGGFTRDAAQIVADANLRVMMSLVNKSLIRRDADSGRYEVHELLRQYASQHLKTQGIFDDTQQKYMNYFTDFVVQRTSDIKGRRQLDALNEIETDFENIRSVWLTSISQQDYERLAQMSECLVLFWDMRTWYLIGKDLFRQVVDSRPLHLSADILPYWEHLAFREAQIWILHEHPDLKSKERIETSLSHAKVNNHHEMVGTCLWLLAEYYRTHLTPNEMSQARHLYEESLTIFNNQDYRYYRCRVLRGITFCSLYLGNEHLINAEKYNQEHLQLTNQDGNLLGKLQAIFFESWIVRIKGDHYAVEQAYKELERLATLTNDIHTTGVIKILQADYDFLKGNFSRAKTLAQGALRIANDTAYNWTKITALRNLGLLAFMENDYESAYEKLSEALPQIPQSNQASVPSIRGASLAAMALIDNIHHIHTALLAAYDDGFSPDFVISCLPIISIILTNQGNRQRAVELLALADSVPDPYVRGWVDHWSVIEDLKEQLKAELNDETYNKAWEQGKTLDLEKLVQELIDEFSKDSN